MILFPYLLTPFIAWFITGILKFLINSYKTRQFAFKLIGYGGMPSNHSAIVSSMVTLIGLRETMHHPAFGVAVTLAFIVLLDANSLRREMGKHAAKINQLDKTLSNTLRERMGHTPAEIGVGLFVGALVALGINKLSSPIAHLA